MKFTIDQLPHTEAKLWPMIGPIVTSREVHKELGGAMFSDVRTMWWVAHEGPVVLGCCCARVTDKGIWIDNAYVVKESRKKGVHAALCVAREKWIEKQQPSTILVCCRASRWPHFEKRGFILKSTRGSWKYAEKPCQKSE